MRTTCAATFAKSSASTPRGTRTGTGSTACVRRTGRTGRPRRAPPRRSHFRGGPPSRARSSPSCLPWAFPRTHVRELPRQAQLRRQRARPLAALRTLGGAQAQRLRRERRKELAAVTAAAPLVLVNPPAPRASGPARRQRVGRAPLRKRWRWAAAAPLTSPAPSSMMKKGRNPRLLQQSRRRHRRRRGRRPLHHPRG